MEKNDQNIDNSYLRYANCWEDADVLIEALDLTEGDSILSIGSGGDNSFSLLINNPKLVVAVDINSHQLSLIELKKACFKALTHTEFIQFLGFKHCSNRIELFEKVSQFLETEEVNYWKDKLTEIEAGIIHQGKFERYFQTFATKVLPKIHSKKKVEELLRSKSGEEQGLFFTKKWNTWRWRLLFKVFFSKYVMGKLGRDPKFLKQVKVPVSTYILAKAEAELSSSQCQSNYFLRYILTNQFGDYLPHYAREENYERIQSNIGKLIVFEGFAEDAFAQFNGFNKFNLSNIFEYMPSSDFEKVGENLLKNSEKGSRFVYWNLMVERYLSSQFSVLIQEKEAMEKANNIDKGFFYKSIVIEQK